MYGSRVKQSTVSTGNGAVILASVTGFATVNSVFSNDTTDTGIPFQYHIVSQDGSEWESGIGKMTTTTSMSRLVIEANSSGTLAAISFSAGTKFVVASPVGRGVLPTCPTVWTAAVARMTGSAFRLTAVAPVAPVANTLYLMQHYHAVVDTLDAVSFLVTAGAAGNATCGIYTIDPTTMAPAELLQQGTAAAVGADLNHRTFTARNLPPGWYFLAANFSGTPTVAWQGLATVDIGGYMPLGCSATGAPTVGFTAAHAYTGTLPNAPGALTAISTGPTLVTRVA